MNRVACLSIVLLLASTADGQIRIWHDKSGRHSTKASLEKLENSKVVLKKASDQIVHVLLSDLSSVDREYLLLRERSFEELCATADEACRNLKQARSAAAIELLKTHPRAAEHQMFVELVERQTQINAEVLAVSNQRATAGLPKQIVSSIAANSGFVLPGLLQPTDEDAERIKAWQRDPDGLIERFKMGQVDRYVFYLLSNPETPLQLIEFLCSDESIPVSGARKGAVTKLRLSIALGNPICSDALRKRYLSLLSENEKRVHELNDAIHYRFNLLDKISGHRSDKQRRSKIGKVVIAEGRLLQEQPHGITGLGLGLAFKTSIELQASGETVFAIAMTKTVSSRTFEGREAIGGSFEGQHATIVVVNDALTECLGGLTHRDRLSLVAVGRQAPGLSREEVSATILKWLRE